MLRGGEFARTGRLATKFLVAEVALVAGAVAPQFFDLIYGANPAARAGRGAVQGSRRAAKFKYCWKCNAAQQGISEAGMEDISRAGGVHRIHSEGGAIVELNAVPGQDAVAAERGAGDAAAEAPRNF